MVRFAWKGRISADGAQEGRRSFVQDLRIDSISKTAYACPDVEEASQIRFPCDPTLFQQPSSRGRGQGEEDFTGEGL